MDFESMYSKLDEIKDTQPEIFKIWKIYLQMKQQRLDDLSRELSLMVDTVKNTPYVNKKLAIMLLCMKDTITNT